MCLRSNSSYTSVMHTSGKKVQIRKPAPGQSDIAPLRRSSRPVIISSSTLKKTPAQQRPLRERLIHLLALKPYKKPELILRLQKDGLLPSDKDSLDSHLQQVTLTHTLAARRSFLVILGMQIQGYGSTHDFCVLFVGGKPEWERQHLHIEGLFL